MAIALRPQICDVTSPYVYATVRRRNCTVRERRVECLKRDKKPQSFSSDVKLDCRAVTLPRSETRLNLQGCPKLANRSQTLVDRNSPYYHDMWMRYCRLTGFFSILDTCLSSEDIYPYKVVRWCQNDDFLRPVFSASRMQHISDMHSKFALRLHHVGKYGRHPISDR